MGNVNSSRRISAQDRAILDLKNQRDKLHAYQKRILALTTRETAIAKTCLAQSNNTNTTTNDNNKENNDDRARARARALLALRRKKFQESLLSKTDAQLAQLEQLTGQVEFAVVQKDVLFGLQQGARVLGAIHAEMGGIDGVERLMGETEEARAYQEEISQMLAGRLSNQDEDEVEDELAGLQREVEGPPPVPVVLPKPPTSELRREEAAQRAKTEEEEVEEEVQSAREEEAQTREEEQATAALAA